MPNSSFVIQTASQITKELGLEDNVLGQPDGLEMLRQRVAAVVEYLLEKDFEKLLNLLYIMDVSEEKIKVALNTPAVDIHFLIADIIIEREWQKVESRIMYKQEKLDDEESWDF